MIGIFRQQQELSRYAGPVKWNDPDMLEVGNGGMTTEEYRTHFSLWCMLAAPLMAGNDLANMTPETKAILMNREIIAIDQDTLGRQATLYRDNGDYQIWVKALANNEKAVCLLNTSDEKKSVLVDFALLAQISTGGRRFGGPGVPGLPGAGAPGVPGATPGGQATVPGVPASGARATQTTPGVPGGFGMQGPGGPGGRMTLTLENYRIRDVWENKDLVMKEPSFYVDMVPHSVKVFRFIRK
jgi:hypothetical protein